MTYLNQLLICKSDVCSKQIRRKYNSKIRLHVDKYYR